MDKLGKDINKGDVFILTGNEVVKIGCLTKK